MTVISGKYSNVESEVYGYLKANGFSLAVISGVLANIEKESSFNPKSYNEKEGAYGLCQWRNSRKTTLFNKYTSNPSVKSQVKFIIDEFNSTEKNARNKLQEVENTLQGAKLAAEYFAKYYERCNPTHYQARIDRAPDYWNHYTDDSTTVLTPAKDLDFSLDDRITEAESSIISNSPAIIPISGDGAILTGSSQEQSSTLTSVSTDTWAKKNCGVLRNVSYGGQFEFYIPEFKESAGVDWQDIRIPGRSIQIKSYNETKSRSVTVNLDLYAGVGFYDTSDPVEKLHSDIRFLKSLEYPDYQGAIAKPPAAVYLRLGKDFHLYGVINEVNIEHQRPFDTQGRSMYVKVSFTFIENHKNPPSQADIRGSQSGASTNASRGSDLLTAGGYNLSDQGYPSSIQG